MLDWLIVGGGVHGMTVAHHLLAAGASRERIRVLDPEGAPLARFHRTMANVGVRFMRSTAVHHIDVDPMSLTRFARSGAAVCEPEFASPYGRPSYRLFAEHCDAVVAARGSGSLCVRGTARRIVRHGGGLRIESTAGAFYARRLVLAPGPGAGTPAIPEFAAALRRTGRALPHVAEPDFDRARLITAGTTAVIGGGLTGTELALALAEEIPGRVVLIRRSRPEVHLFDSDPGWLGPKHLDGFSRLSDPAMRRRVIDAARRRGSITPETDVRLGAALRTGALRIVAGEVVAASEATAGAELAVRTYDAGRVAVRAAAVVLATGLSHGVARKGLIATTADELRLPLAQCGTPWPDERLHWGVGIFVVGAAAELRLGPAARNIAGARMAAAATAKLVAEDRGEAAA